MNYNLWMVYNISVCKLALIHRELIFHTWFMSARCLVTASLYLATLNAWHDTFTLTLHIHSICTTVILWTFEAFRGEWIPCIDASTIYLGSYGLLARVNTSYNILNFYMKFIYDFLNHNCTPNGKKSKKSVCPTTLMHAKWQRSWFTAERKSLLKFHSLCCVFCCCYCCLFLWAKHTPSGKKTVTWMQVGISACPAIKKSLS